jgi:2-polyprenyl-3-methyl-5-hydroxy-6-metoxy-1,4-benzoquinol methylase
MPDLRKRSYEKELLDRDDIPFSDIKRNMKELNTVNSLLGGHAITIEGIRRLTERSVKTSFHVCEIGCGGGDNLFAIHKWARRHKIDIRFTGIDIKAACIEYAKEQYPLLPAKWIISDYAEAEFYEKPDIIFSSLFCHHFPEKELQFMFRWKAENSRLGFFINDLERNRFAYHAIRILTQIVSGSYLVKNDAPLSVARGFHKDELSGLIRAAGLKPVPVLWRWAFRYLVIYRHEQFS